MSLLIFFLIFQKNIYSETINDHEKAIKAVNEGEILPLNEILKNIELEKVDFIFIDGGHEYNTVKNDLVHSHRLLKNKGTILCDDLNLSQALGVRQAIKEFSDENKIKYEGVHERFAKFNI